MRLPRAGVSGGPSGYRLIASPLIVDAFGEGAVDAGLALGADAVGGFFTVFAIKKGAVLYAGAGFGGGGQGGDVAEGDVGVVLHQAFTQFDVIAEKVGLAVDAVAALAFRQAAGAEHYLAAVETGSIYCVSAYHLVPAMARINRRVVTEFVADRIDHDLRPEIHRVGVVEIPGRDKVHPPVQLDRVVENTADDIQSL